MRRDTVLWFGSRGGRRSSLEYERRELTLQVLTSNALTDADLRPARGIVYWFGENEVTQTGIFAEATIHRALDHGLAVIVLAADSGIVEHVRREMDRLGIPDLITYRVEEQDEVPDHEIAQRMLRAEPKKAWSGELVIDMAGVPFVDSTAANTLSLTGTSTRAQPLKRRSKSRTHGSSGEVAAT